jgi:NAD(P)-dependent dehydrogenase (short-subunit alcohol dehydrogenase family)
LVRSPYQSLSLSPLRSSFPSLFDWGHADDLSFFPLLQILPRLNRTFILIHHHRPLSETFQAVHRINLLGSFLIASRVASVLVKQYLATLPPGSKAPKQAEEDQGVIVLTSSVSATEGQMGQVAYGSSKAAVEGLVLPMSRDLARYGAFPFFVRRFPAFFPLRCRLRPGRVQ